MSHRHTADNPTECIVGLYTPCNLACTPNALRDRVEPQGQLHSWRQGLAANRPFDGFRTVEKPRQAQRPGDFPQHTRGVRRIDRVFGNLVPEFTLLALRLGHSMLRLALVFHAGVNNLLWSNISGAAFIRRFLSRPRKLPEEKGSGLDEVRVQAHAQVQNGHFRGLLPMMRHVQSRRVGCLSAGTRIKSGELWLTIHHISRAPFWLGEAGGMLIARGYAGSSAKGL